MVDIPLQLVSWKWLSSLSLFSLALNVAHRNALLCESTSVDLDVMDGIFLNLGLVRAESLDADLVLKQLIQLYMTG